MHGDNIEVQKLGILDTLWFRGFYFTLLFLLGSEAPQTTARYK